VRALGLTLSLALTACHRSPPQPIPKFDVHTHINPDGMRRTLEIFAANGIAGGVNLSGGSSPGMLAYQLRSAQAASGRMLVFANLDFQHVFEPGWVEGQVAWLGQAKEMGARGLKIFKILGLNIRDRTGARVAVDDPRLDPIFEAAGRLGLPVAIHVGDPKAFFEPTNEANERYEELALNPNWSWADRTRFPTWEQLHGEFEHLVARHPNTTFIGVHFGNDPEEPARVAEMLDKYPNLYIDTAARVPEIGRFPADKLREIFLAHQKRILFGTDIAVSSQNLTLGCPEPYPETPETVTRFYAAHWHFFETPDQGFAHPSPVQGHWTIDGINLPREALEDLYHRNAERLFGLAPLTLPTPGK
jgi:predicted TIM-barrel fold metal-dependent hydrolase